MRTRLPPSSSPGIPSGKVRDLCRAFLNAAGVNYVTYQAGLKFALSLERSFRMGCPKTRTRRLERLVARWAGLGMDEDLCRRMVDYCVERLWSEWRRERQTMPLPRRLELVVDRAIVAYREELHLSASTPVTPRHLLLAFCRELYIANRADPGPDWNAACKRVVQKWWNRGVPGRLLALVGEQMRGCV